MRHYSSQNVVDSRGAAFELNFRADFVYCSTVAPFDQCSGKSAEIKLSINFKSKNTENAYNR